jgi:hypothetical protein
VLRPSCVRGSVSLLEAHLPHQGKVQAEDVEADGRQPELDTDAPGMAARDELAAGDGVAAVGGPRDEVVVDVDDGKVPDEDPVPEGDVLEEGREHEVLDENCGDVQDGEPDRHRDDDPVGLVAQGHEEGGGDEGGDDGRPDPVPAERDEESAPEGAPDVSCRNDQAPDAPRVPRDAPLVVVHLDLLDAPPRDPARRRVAELVHEHPQQPHRLEDPDLPQQQRDEGIPRVEANEHDSGRVAAAAQGPVDRGHGGRVLI